MDLRMVTAARELRPYFTLAVNWRVRTATARRGGGKIEPPDACRTSERVEPRKTKAELEKEIASLRARVSEKKALMDRSVGVRRRIAQIESKALRGLLKRLIEQLRTADDS
jgi:hypothetical protein